MLIELSKILILWNLRSLSAGLSSVIHTPYQWIYSFLILWNRFRGKSDEKALGLQRSKRRVNCCLCNSMKNRKFLLQHIAKSLHSLVCIVTYSKPPRKINVFYGKNISLQFKKQFLKGKKITSCSL